MPDNVSAAQRLRRALSHLIDRHASDNAPGTITATALCRRAGVSRTALYRYHTDILNELRQLQRRHYREAAPDQQTLKALKALREENAALRTQQGRLAALVDHYFAAWSECQALLKRREGELEALRRTHKTKLALVRAQPESDPGK